MKNTQFIALLFAVFSSCAQSRVSAVVLFPEELNVCICDEARAFADEVKYLTKHLNAISEKPIRVDTKCKGREYKISLVSKAHDTKYRIKVEQELLTFEAATSANMRAAINHFFVHVLGYVPYEFKKSTYQLKSIPLPSIRTIHGQNPAFDYREPYFIENYHEDFRQIHQTHVLDNSWGLWGHNIPKKIRLNGKMLAQVNGRPSDEQLCFSSPELTMALVQFIQKSHLNNPEANKFMIVPLDNLEVCTCENCSKLGNTKSNASPAVFTLINTLASQFTDLTFYGAAYHTTRSAPDFNLQSNVGVMFTTMDYPKGLVLKESKAAQKISKDISSWKLKTERLFLWDYVIHFDQYLSTYPTVLATQQNLQWFRELGVTGVFLHGTEEMFAAFSDLKAFLYAELLNNPHLDVQAMMRTYFNNFYPQTGALLAEYYWTLESKAMSNKYPLDIYGGWNQHLRKYLDIEHLSNTLDSLEKLYPQCQQYEQDNLQSIIFALRFQRLEMMRLLGIKPHGLLKFDEKGQSWRLNDFYNNLLSPWLVFAKQFKITHLNESRLGVEEYFSLWEKRIMHHNWKSVILGQKPEVLSKLDEDYKDASVLTDGALGFSDYFNNWLLVTQEPLHVRIPIPPNNADKYFLEIGFLESKRHRIQLPESITINSGENTQNFLVVNNLKRINGSVYRFSIALEKPRNGVLEIIFNKSKEYEQMSIAVDEIELIPNKKQ